MTPQALKTLRTGLNLSRKELGQRVGVSARTIENWEQGRRPIRKPAELLITALNRKQ